MFTSILALPFHFVILTWDSFSCMKFTCIKMAKSSALTSLIIYIKKINNFQHEMLYVRTTVYLKIWNCGSIEMVQLF